MYLSDVRLVFVAAPNTGGPVAAFDVPLLYVRNERFVQPIFGANYLALHTFNVALGPDHAPHYVTLTFKEGGCATFLPLWHSALALARAGDVRSPRVDVGAAEVELRELRSSALVDPSDPTLVFLPVSDSTSGLSTFQCDETATEPEQYPVTGLRRRHAATVAAVEE